MSTQYFNGLNYTLANEDSSLEMEILPEGVDHVLCVAGSGARVLPLFAKNPHLMTVVDVSQEQLYLTQMRIESVRALTLNQYLQFWGYAELACTPDERKDLFKLLKLTAEAKIFFEKVFEQWSWKSILLSGKWEQTFIKISKIAQFFIGEHAHKLFEFKSLIEQQEYLDKDFPRLKWLAGLAVVGNAGFFNALLYKGHFPKKNISDSHFTFYKRAFDSLFSLSPARRNFFLQLALIGELKYSDGYPIECYDPVFTKIKNGIQNAKIEYVCESVVDAVSRQTRKVNFVSISDVPSYFDDNLERQFLNKMHLGLSEDALVVIRYYLKVARFVDNSLFERVTSQYFSAIESEKTQMYLVDVYQNKKI